VNVIGEIVLPIMKLEEGTFEEDVTLTGITVNVTVAVFEIEPLTPRIVNAFDQRLVAVPERTPFVNVRPDGIGDVVEYVTVFKLDGNTIAVYSVLFETPR
jgi:hypothetical protein